jgi:hypothetical protein
MRAQWFQACSVSDRSCEHVGDKDPAAQGLAQCLDPRNLIDRGADNRKVKAIDSTYIAIEHLAKMECEIDGGNRLAHLCSVSVKAVKAVHCFGSGVERGLQVSSRVVSIKAKLASMPSPRNFST